MKRRNLIASLLFPVLLVLAACSSAVPYTPVQPSPTTGVAAKGGWQQDWDNALAAAKKEGSLVIFSTVPPETKESLTRLVKEKFNVQAEWVIGRANELAEKLLTERRAGIYSADIYLSGGATAITVLKPAGVMESFDKLLILPEVRDPSKWWEGKPAWWDKENTMYAILAIVKQSIAINTEAVKPEEIKSWRDLLNPKWKGKITMDDPTISGSGSATFSALASGLMDVNYLRELAKQDLVITRDRRLMGEWVARGKYPIGIAIDDAVQTELIRAGAPIKLISPVEGNYITASSGGVGVVNKMPHQNAAKAFVNWVLSQDGGTAFSKIYGGQSARTDVPTDHLDPAQVRQSSVKYLNTTSEEVEFQKLEGRKLAQEILGHLIK